MLTVRLTISYQLFQEFWLVHTFFFVYSRHQDISTRLENVRQLNERWGKKLDIKLSNRQSLNAVYRHSLLEITHENKYLRNRKLILDYWNIQRNRKQRFFCSPSQDKASLKFNKYRSHICCNCQTNMYHSIYTTEMTFQSFEDFLVKKHFPFYFHTFLVEPFLTNRTTCHK